MLSRTSASRSIEWAPARRPLARSPRDAHGLTVNSCSNNAPMPYRAKSMSELSEWMSAANSSCPLDITRSEWSDPVFHIGGTEWSFSTTSPWRIVKGGTVLRGVYDENAGELMPSILGSRVVRFAALPGSPLLDISISLDSGDEIQVFCATTHENWVLRLSGKPTMAFVPPL
jgi:hypothetical protein